MATQNHQPIAVVGLACRYPGASTPVELWENILARRQQFRVFPDVRLPQAQYFSQNPATADKTYAAHAAVLDGFEFDYKAFRIPKTTFESTDIVHWLALATALQAFEDAGITGEKLPLERTGVILGNTLTGEETRANTLRLRWPYVLKAFRQAAQNQGIQSANLEQFENTFERLYKSAFSPITEDSLAGGLANTIAGRICNYLDLKGGGYIVDGACSSSLLAISTAADYLHQNKLDLVLAGGIDISLDPFELVGFAKATALTPDRMRVYDQRGNGFIPGEGCGMVVLKRLEDAEKDGNRIYAVLRGWGISSDGRGGMTAPSSEGQARALVRAYQSAGYSPQCLDFIEGHGTGTAVGDRIELEGISRALAQFGNTPEHSIGVTSFKSIVGHTKAASGIGGFIKSVIAVNRRILPPTADCTRPHSSFSDTAKSLYPITDGQIYRRKAQLKAGVSAMGFGGINCHVTLESGDLPSLALETKIPESQLLASYQQTEVFPLAARTTEQLLDKISELQQNAQGITQGEFTDLAAECSRQPLKELSWRAAIVAENVEDLLAKLQQLTAKVKLNDLGVNQVWRLPQILLSYQAEKPRIGFLFPGQGSQQINMASQLVKRFSWAQALVEDADHLSQIVWDNDYQQNLSQFWLRASQRDPANIFSPHWRAQLTETQLAQPAICTASWLWFQRLKHLGIQPNLVAGHSLGELTALAAASCYSPQRLLQLAALRGMVMENNAHEDSAMLALACDLKTAKELLAQIPEYCVIANINAPNQIVLSGSKQAISSALLLAASHAILATPLQVSGGFHSDYMVDAAKHIANNELIPTQIQMPLYPVYSSMDGELIGNQLNLRDYLARQLVMPVDFSLLIQNITPKCDWLIEVGPGRVLSNLVAQHNQLNCHPVESRAGNDRDLNTIMAEAFVRGLMLDWNALYQNRLLRPFIPASKRRFYTNPCERPLTNSTVQSSDPIVTSPITSASSNSQPSVQTPREVLLKLICQRTGFEANVINDDARLIDDLNLDSIKIGGLLADAALQCGIAGKIDPIQLLSSTVGSVIAAFESAVSDAEIQPAVSPPKAQWVRGFQQIWLPSEVHTVINELQHNLIIGVSGLNQFTADFAQAINSPVYAELPDSLEPVENLLILWQCNADQNTSERIQQLCLLHDLAQKHPQHWNHLQSIYFLVSQSSDQPQLAIDAFAASVQQERPGLEVTVIEFDNSLSANWLAKCVTREKQNKAGFVYVRFDAQALRLVPQLQTLDLDQCHNQQLQWTADDVVLVTGGGKGITAECALALAQTYGVKLALLGRSAETDPEVAHNLLRLQESNITHCYLATDLADSHQLRNSIQQIQDQLGTITAVLHGAGINHPRPVAQVNAALAAQEIAPKLLGLEYLLDQFAHSSLKWFGVLTSIIGVSGMRNNAWYAFANQMAALKLNAYAQTHPETATLAYAYSIWDEVGMGVKLGSVQYLQSMGITAIPPKDGIRQFLRWLKFSPACSQVIIDTQLKPNPLTHEPNILLSGRFLGNVVSDHPGIERMTKVTIACDTDLYLQDHNYHGSRLMPSVMGLEAMAQNASVLMSRPDLEIIRIEQIRLDQPILVQPEQPASLLIHCLIQERESFDAPYCVESVIYVKHVACFRANLIFGQRLRQRPDKAIAIGQTLAIVPQRDLYGSILFQGPLFQRIRSLHSLSNQQVIFTSHADLCAGPNPPGFSEDINAPLVLGDPYYRDALLQSAQLAITPELALPVYIESIELFQGNQEPGYRLVKTQITDRETQRITGAVDVLDRQGQLVERIRGYQAQVISKNEHLPSPEQIIFQAEHSNAFLLQNALDQWAQQFHCLAPTVVLHHLSELCKQDREARRALELPVIRSAITLAEQRLNLANQPIRIDWQNDGKPQVISDLDQQNRQPRPNVSLSHDQDWLMCIAGVGPQGCDLAKVIEQTEAQWQALISAERYACVEQSVAEGESLNQAGTRIWAAIEASFKALNQHPISLKRIHNEQGMQLFEASAADHCIQVLTLATELEGQNYIMAFTLTPTSINNSTRTSSNWSTWLAEGNTTNELLGVQIVLNDGPQTRHLRFCFPLSFKETSNPDGTLYFARLPDWMGRLREIALRPVLKQLSSEFTSGEYAWVTNQSWLRMINPAQSGDVLEVTCRFVDRGGPHNATVKLVFEWFKREQSGTLSTVGYSQIEMTWTRVLSHGVVTPVAYPDYLDAFFQEFSNTRVSSELNQPQQQQIAQSTLGKRLWQAPASLEQQRRLHSSQTATSLQDANLVGNLYYTKYYELQGLLRDQYLHGLFPEAFQIPPVTGGLRCIYSQVQHLRDAMPFDTIETRMSLRAVYEFGVALNFEFYRVTTGQPLQRLAIGEQLASWSTLDSKQGVWQNHLMPSTVYESLLQQPESQTSEP